MSSEITINILNMTYLSQSLNRYCRESVLNRDETQVAIKFCI